MDWISVEDRLPEIVSRDKGNPCSDKVLVTDGQEMQVGVRWICGNEEFFFADHRETIGQITHWMPLPKPPVKKLKK